MSLKNGVKKTTTVAKCMLENDTIITLVGEVVQSATKLDVCVSVNRTTPGGKVLKTYDDIHLDGIFDNQGGIRKELYMGWSVCAPEDKNVYDLHKGIKYAKKHFSRPIVTYNFTYLNKDQVECLMRNEIEHIRHKFFNDMKIVEFKMFNV